MAGKQPKNVVKYKYEEEYIVNSRGLNLFTCRWLPTDREAKALICICHEYGVECSIFMKDTGVRLANSGYAVFGIDYAGHGKSAGRRCYIKNFDSLVTDCATFFKTVAERPEYRKKARLLYGESMGGAVALLIHRKQPDFWNGAVLVAPMCKISKDIRPPSLLNHLFKKLRDVIPTWKIVPRQHILEAGCKSPEKRKQILENPYVYRGRPRLKTWLELLRTCSNIQKRLDEVTLPFLVLHGEDDKVTDPAMSNLLHACAKSSDKTLKMYPTMWHALTYGENPHHIEMVFVDIVAWLGKRSEAARSSEDPPSETSAESDLMKKAAAAAEDKERKLANDEIGR